MLASKITEYSNQDELCARRFKNVFVQFLEPQNLRNGIYTKMPKMNLFENLELVLICNSNSIWNLVLLIKTKLQGFCFETTLLLGENGENDFKVVQMILKKSLRKEIQKKNRKGKGGASRPRPRFWPAGVYLSLYYIRIDQIEPPLEPLQLRVPSGASKMVSQPMVHQP